MVLSTVIDRLMRLSVDLDKKLGEDIQRIEEAHKIPYVTSIERIGIEKGRAGGGTGSIPESPEVVWQKIRQSTRLGKNTDPLMSPGDGSEHGQVYQRGQWSCRPLLYSDKIDNTYI